MKNVLLDGPWNDVSGLMKGQVLHLALLHGELPGRVVEQVERKVECTRWSPRFLSFLKATSGSWLKVFFRVLSSVRMLKLRHRMFLTEMLCGW